jgi:hypothetical protein
VTYDLDVIHTDTLIHEHVFVEGIDGADARHFWVLGHPDDIVDHCKAPLIRCHGEGHPPLEFNDPHTAAAHIRTHEGAGE